MSQTSTIEWTDATWPIVQGCDYDSPGCKRCYAVRDIWRMMHNPNPAIARPLQGLVRKTDQRDLVWTGKVVCRHDRLDWPLKWKKGRRIFVPSLGDIFHDDVPDEFLHQIFTVAICCPHHTLQVLTKRSARLRRYMDKLFGTDIAPHGYRCPPWNALMNRAEAAWLKADANDYMNRLRPMLIAGLKKRGPLPSGPLPNIWIGVSVEDRKRLARLDDLKNTPAAIRFVSFEPLLENLGEVDLAGIHWAILGGESGPPTEAREHDVEWDRRLIAQCRAQGVAAFEKQLGSRPVDSTLVADGDAPALGLRHKKGADMTEWPADLRVREMPKVRP